jgi:hypothetical protein
VHKLKQDDINAHRFSEKSKIATSVVGCWYLCMLLRAEICWQFSPPCMRIIGYSNSQSWLNSWSTSEGTDLDSLFWLYKGLCACRPQLAKHCAVAAGGKNSRLSCGEKRLCGCGVLRVVSNQTPPPLALQCTGYKQKSIFDLAIGEPKNQVRSLWHRRPSHHLHEWRRNQTKKKREGYMPVRVKKREWYLSARVKKKREGYCGPRRSPPWPVVGAGLQIPSPQASP